MVHLYRLSIAKSYSFEGCWKAFEKANLEILYGSKEEKGIEFFVYLSSLDQIKVFNWITAASLYNLPSVDWQEQWASHAYQFQDGYVNIDFTLFHRSASSLRLKPGPGFGDLSHPTTYLMVKLLAKYLEKQIVIDIGCGSGILSLVAIALGSPKAYGIDIDCQALEHSWQNARLNHLEQQCSFLLPSNFSWHSSSYPIFILMNMIFNEQMTAWSSLSSLHNQNGELLTSGIRTEERSRYLAEMVKKGWLLKEEQEEKEWWAFYFQK